MLFTVVICILTGFVSTETGSVIPGELMDLHGYATLDTPENPGIGEWTGSGPWGGNIKALVPSYSDDSIVLAGCGFSMTPDAGGVFRSTDGGATWSATELFPIPVNDICSGGPQSPSSFYAATRTGLYLSEDLGVTWAAVSGMGTSYVIGIGASSGSSDILIAGLSSNNGVRRTSDGGATWDEVGLSSGYMKGFGCDPDHPDTMYLAMSGLDYALYRSTDAGLTWSSIGPSGSGWGLLVAPFGTGETIIVTTSDGFYMTQDYGVTWDLAVSGGSYAPAVCHDSNLYAPVNTAAGVYESTDQGQNWTLNTQGIGASYWQAGCSSSLGYLAGHYGGVYSTSAPAGNYAVSQQGINNGYFHALSYMAGTNTLLAGGEHHGLWKSTDLGATWEIILPGPGSWTIYDIAPQADNHYSGSVRYAATASGVFRSDDGGDSWAPAGFAGTQISSVAFDPEDPDRAWAGTATSGVHYTTNGGASWTAGSGFPFALYPAIDLIPNSSGDIRVLVSFQQNGAGVYYSDNGGVSYSTSAVPGSYHPDVSADWGGSGGMAPLAFLATDGGVFRSWDRGTTWDECGATPGLIWEVLGGLDNDVFAGTNGSGVYWSPNIGYNWYPLNTNIENRVVWDSSYGSTNTQIFASLRGFGVVELTDDQLGIEGPESTMNPSIHVSSNPVSSSVVFEVSGMDGAFTQLSIYSMSGRLVHASSRNSGSSFSWIPDEQVPDGVYLVRCISGNESVSTKLVVTR